MDNVAYVPITYIAQLQPGLPVGIFSYQKAQFGYILEGHCCYILCPLGIFNATRYILLHIRGDFVIYFHFGTLYR
jgi:hypothetical protein